MFFLLFFVPIGFLCAYLSFICMRQKYTGAALLMGGIAAVCTIISFVIIAAAFLVVKTA